MGSDGANLSNSRDSPNSKLCFQMMPSLFDGIGMGLGFTMALTILGAVREILGTGKLFGLTLMPEEYGMLVFVLAPGAFIALGYLIAIVNKMRKA